MSGFHFAPSLPALKEPHYFESLPTLVSFPHDHDLQFAGLTSDKPLFRPKKFTMGQGDGNQALLMLKGSDQLLPWYTTFFTHDSLDCFPKMKD